MAITVRPAESSDAGGIARVCVEGWRNTYTGIYTPEHVESVIAEYYTVERIRGEIAAPEGWDGWIVAIEDGSVVGAGGGGMIEPRAGEVFVLYLDPRRRREGIGTLLLDAITRQQLAQGAREQWVSVEPENEKGLPFYEARGFQVQGKRRAWGSAPEKARFSLRLVRRLDQSRAQQHESWSSGVIPERWRSRASGEAASTEPTPGGEQIVGRSARQVGSREYDRVLPLQKGAARCSI